MRTWGRIIKASRDVSRVSKTVSLSVSCRQVHARSRWRTAALAHREDPRSITRKQVVCFKPTYFKTHARAVNNTIQQKIRANWARVYSSDFGFVYTFTPLLNETGRICLKTAHVAVTKPGALMMRVPFRSAPPYRPRQPVAGRGGGEGEGGEAAHSRDSTASSPW